MCWGSSAKTWSWSPAPPATQTFSWVIFFLTNLRNDSFMTQHWHDQDCTAPPTRWCDLIRWDPRMRKPGNRCGLCMCGTGSWDLDRSSKSKAPNPIILLGAVSIQLHFREMLLMMTWYHKLIWLSQTGSKNCMSLFWAFEPLAFFISLLRASIAPSGWRRSEKNSCKIPWEWKWRLSVR